MGTDGLPREVKIVRRLDADLDDSAIAAVHAWRYEPARRNGEPVEVEIHARVRFRLYEGNSRRIAELWDRSDNNDPKADLQLSKAYFEGDGVPRNDELGFQFLKMAADWNLPEAQFLLGEHYYRNAGGDLDYVAAYMWYALSKRAGGLQGEPMLRVLASEMSREQLTDAERRVSYWPEDPPRESQ